MGDILDSAFRMMSPLLMVASAVFFGLALLRWLIGLKKKESEYWRSGVKFFLAAVLMFLGSAIFMPRFPRAREQGKLTACKSHLKNYATASEMYRTDFLEYPVSVTQLAPNYLKTLPECPSARAVSYHYERLPGEEPDTYEFYIFCQGAHHSKNLVPENYPAYSSQDGLIER